MGSEGRTVGWSSCSFLFFSSSFGFFKSKLLLIARNFSWATVPVMPMLSLCSSIQEPRINALEPFCAYVNHCNLRGGPRREGADQGSSCFSPSGDTCEVAQQEDCSPYGEIIDVTDSAPDAPSCEKICVGYADCQMWTFETEEKRCRLWDDASMRCNKVFGPHSGSPQECGSTLL